MGSQGSQLELANGFLSPDELLLFRYLHTDEHFEWGAKDFTQNYCNCPHPSIALYLTLHHLRTLGRFA